MSNPILETYKHKATGTVYDLADRDARAAIEGINAVIPVDTSGTNMLVTESELTSELASGLAGKVNTSSVGSANGVAGLDSNGLVPASQLPSYVDDVLEGTAQNVTETAAGTFAATGFILKGESVPCTLEDGKTYVDTASNIQYRWTGSGTNLVSMGSNLTLGETANTAYAGSKGKANADAIAGMKDGTNIDSFGDVEAALALKQNKTLNTTVTVNEVSQSTVEGAIGALADYTSDLDNDLADVAAALSNVTEVANDNATEIDKLNRFEGSETLLDSSGNEILDSSGDRILDTQIGAAGLVITVNNIVSWFKNSLGHLLVDSDYSQAKAEYEIINS